MNDRIQTNFKKEEKERTTPTMGQKKGELKKLEKLMSTNKHYMLANIWYVWQIYVCQTSNKGHISLSTEA